MGEKTGLIRNTMKIAPKFMTFTSHQGKVVYVYGVKYLFYNSFLECKKKHYRYKKVSSKKPNLKV